MSDYLLAGRYRLTDRIAAGGMGEVWPGEGCGGFTERDYAALASTDSKQRRFSTQLSTQRDSVAKFGSRISCL